MNEVVLISGASSDIGSALCNRLQGEYDLVLHARSADKLKSAYPNSEHLPQLISDLKTPTHIQSCLEEYYSSSGKPISHFVHCAGTLRIDSIKRIDYAQQMDIFNVNLFSAIQIIRSLLNKQNCHALKSIVLVSALFSKRGSIGNSIYAASKGALDSLVKSLALELAPKIRINSILPGAIITKMSQKTFPNDEAIAQITNEYPLGLGSVDDVASLARFLISKDAKWITGQNIILDGGRSCK